MCVLCWYAAATAAALLVIWIADLWVAHRGRDFL